MVDINPCMFWFSNNLILINLNKKFANYYCIDNPGALHNALYKYFESELGPNFEYFFNLLYSLVILPNIALPFLGGLLITKFGIRKMYFIFVTMLLIGHFVFAMGCSFKQIIVMLIGKTLFYILY